MLVLHYMFENVGIGRARIQCSEHSFLADEKPHSSRSGQITCEAAVMDNHSAEAQTMPLSKLPVDARNLSLSERRFHWFAGLEQHP